VNGNEKILHNFYVNDVHTFREAKTVSNIWAYSRCHTSKGKGRAIPLQALTGREGYRLRLPDFKTSAHEGGNVVSLTHQLPGNIPGTHFCQS
jgi:hypothetical protein